MISNFERNTPNFSGWNNEVEPSTSKSSCREVVGEKNQHKEALVPNLSIQRFFYTMIGSWDMIVRIWDVENWTMIGSLFGDYDNSCQPLGTRVVTPKPMCNVYSKS
jgi:hypothetical protein